MDEKKDSGIAFWLTVAIVVFEAFAIYLLINY